MQTAKVVTKSIHLHDVPAGKITGALQKGDVLEVLKREQRPQHLWIRVRSQNTGKVGWVAASPKWVKLNPIPMPPPPDVEPYDEPFEPTPIIVGAIAVAIVLALAFYFG